MRIVPLFYIFPFQHLKLGYDAEITRSWDGKPTQHEPIRIHMRWHFERQHGKPHKRVVRVSIEAPLFDEDPEPEEFSGICPGVRSSDSAVDENYGC